MTNTTLRGKPDAGNPHVRFDEGGSRIGGNAGAFRSLVGLSSGIRLA